MEKPTLYDPRFEHDACGVGVVANTKGKMSHEIVVQGLEAVSYTHLTLPTIYSV